MAVEATEEFLSEARTAFGAHDWAAAFELFSAADERGGMGAEDLLAFADAAYWVGRLELSLVVMERAYAAYLEVGDDCGAALAALLLHLDHRTRPALSVAAGWRRRAQRLLEGKPECVAHGYLAQARVALALSRGDLEEALVEARRVVELGARLGARDLETLGLERVGQILVARGEVREGLELLDEAVVTAISGELGMTATAVIYCSAITACRDLGDWRRAGEWSEAAMRWCEREAASGFPGLCRVYHGEIQRRRGQWVAAEAQVRRACEELAGFGVLAMAAAGQYELGEIRRLTGNLDGAETAFRQALEWGLDPQPGLALLWLERGDVDAALAALCGAVADRQPQPERAEGGWHESRDRLARGRLLPALVEVALADGDLDLAREVAAELVALAGEYDSTALNAEAAYARATVALADRDMPSALEAAVGSVRLWQELEMPYETARSRTVLALARQASGDLRLAGLELQAAVSTFERLGAKTATVRAKRLLRDLPSPLKTGRVPGELTRRELQILRLVGEGLTDAEIAERLVLSRHTVHRHLANVRAKLGQPSRSAAVAHAARLGLL